MLRFTTNIICTPTPTSPLVINKDRFLNTKPIIPDGDKTRKSEEYGIDLDHFHVILFA